jgi:DNA-binding transcriptional MerR regulator
VDNQSDAYVEKMKTKIDRWKVEIDKLQAKADRAKTDAQIQYRHQMQELMAKRHDLEEKMMELQKAKVAAWQDMKAGVDTARHALGKSIKAAKSRFN